MAIKIALAGNPNCGKTTLFNALTGSNQYVGNWPGVTVEKKEGHLKGRKDVIITDLPGIYSLSPYTLEEVVTRNVLIDEAPDVILNLVDATNLERNLYLTLQLLEMGIPVVIALNMMDIVRKGGDRIDSGKLSETLGCPVVEISALKGEGCVEAAQRAVAEAGKTQQHHLAFEAQVEQALEKTAQAAQEILPEKASRWYTVKLLERDEKVLAALQPGEGVRTALEQIAKELEEQEDDEVESVITAQRYGVIARVTDRCFHKGKRGLTTSDKIDRIITNRVLALPIFAVVMFVVYAIAMGSWDFSIGTLATDWTNDVLFGEWVPGWIDSLLLALQVPADGWLYSLIQDGIVGGVGAVLGFVPQMLVLFLLLSILENCGYMARIAFIMDRIFRRFGLSGKSFIPLLVATGCGVPGIMASRTIEQDHDRKLTIMTTGFIPCGAKMPIIGLFAGALFGGSAWVATSAFFIGIAAVVISGIILKKFKAFAGDPAPFVMELPPYHLPTLGNILRPTWERGWSFIKRAGTVILLSSIVLWFLQGFGVENGVFGMVEDNNSSLLAAIGRVVAWIFYPLGWIGDWAWKAAVATVTGLIAKEEVVATFGVLYNFAGELSEAGDEIWPLIAADFSVISAYSFMIFNLLCAPCFAAMGAIKREMNNRKWTFAAIGYMCAFAYVVSMIVYQIGGLILGVAPLSVWTVVAVLLLVGMIYLLVRRGWTENDPQLHRAAGKGGKVHGLG